MRLANKAVPNKSPAAFDDAVCTPMVLDDIERQAWSQASIGHLVDLEAWKKFLPSLPRDPYVNARWKRMSWVQISEDGEVEVMGDCPMAQGGKFNDADTMADKLRYYPALEPAFTDRDDFKAFVRGWAKLWGIGPREPILFQINGIKGKGKQDPLQGQGIHADGCHYLSIMVINRENVEGATNHLYVDKEGRHKLAEIRLAPGEILHLRDDRLFHSIDHITQRDEALPYERFIVIINSRFVDDFQNRMLRRHFPDAVINGPLQ